MNTYEEFYKEHYACHWCRSLANQMPQTLRFVKGNTFFLFSPSCEWCVGTGIQAIPIGELRGQTYEAWKANPAVP